MRIRRIETTVSGDGTVTLKNMPFPPGEHVEVVVCAGDVKRRGNNAYPLRGKPIQYLDPFGGVADGDGEAAQ
jgi:hypothetical protein